MLSIRNFSKRYNDSTALSIDVLDIKQGVHWIKGENGSGKTTFFKSLAGLLPHNGEVYFDNGIYLNKHAVKFRKLVNYGEAEPTYPGFLTAKDLIRFISNAKGATREQQNELVDQFQINAFFEKPCETYSSGMMKKLSLAIAFLSAPRLIILDEPLITLDEAARNILFALINKYVSQHEVSFLISSHQLIENTAIDITSTYLISNKKITLV